MSFNFKLNLLFLFYKVYNRFLWYNPKINPIYQYIEFHKIIFFHLNGIQRIKDLLIIHT